MVLLVTVLAGIASNDINEFADRVVSSLSSLVSYLADSLASMSTYFVLFVLVQALVVLPAELFRPAYWFEMWLDPQDKDRFPFGNNYAKSMLILTICFCYSAMSPLIFVFVLLFFVVAAFVWLYQLSSCYLPAYDTGALIFPFVFQRISVGLTISVATMVSLFVLKKAFFQALFLLPLFFVIPVFQNKMEAKFKPVFESASLTSARERDAEVFAWIKQNGKDRDKQTTGTAAPAPAGAGAGAGIYLPPIMARKFSVVT